MISVLTKTIKNEKLMKKITKLIFLVVAIVAWSNVANAQNNSCAGWSTEANAGSFALGYNYSFKTSGTTVIFTCEMLDVRTGETTPIARGYTTPVALTEHTMTQVYGRKYTYTFTGVAADSTVSVDCKSIYSGGFSATKTLTYIAGHDCGASTDVTAPTGFTATAGTGGFQSINLLLNATDENGGLITYTISYGAGPTTVLTDGLSGTQKSYTITGINTIAAANYTVTAKDAAGNTTSAIVVSAIPGFVGTCSPAVASGYSIANLFDGTNTTGWKVATILTSYLTFNYSVAQVFNKITLTAFTSASRYPTAWKVEASNDTVANGWTILDTQTAQTFGTNEVKPYTFSNTIAYTWYRLHITAGYASSTYLGELAFSNVGGTTGLISTKNLDVIGLYPNPIAKNLTVSAQSEISEVTVRNLLGQSVKMIKTNNQSKTIDLSDLSAGNYFVSVKLANGQLTTQKVVKL